MSACTGDRGPRLKVIWKTAPSLQLYQRSSSLRWWSQHQHPPVKLFVLVFSSSLKAAKSFHVSATTTFSTTQEDESKDTMLVPLMRHLFLNQTIENSCFSPQSDRKQELCLHGWDQLLSLGNGGHQNYNCYLQPAEEETGDTDSESEIL